MRSDDTNRPAPDVRFVPAGVGHTITGMCAKCNHRGKCASIRWPAGHFNSLCESCREIVKGKK